MKIGNEKETKNYYWEWVPVFESTREITVVDYCDSCGQEDGSHTESEGINLLGYEYKRFKKNRFHSLNKTMEKLIFPKVVDSILNDSVLKP